MPSCKAASSGAGVTAVLSSCENSCLPHGRPSDTAASSSPPTACVPVCAKPEQRPCDRLASALATDWPAPSRQSVRLRPLIAVATAVIEASRTAHPQPAPASSWARQPRRWATQPAHRDRPPPPVPVPDLPDPEGVSSLSYEPGPVSRASQRRRKQSTAHSLAATDSDQQHCVSLPQNQSAAQSQSPQHCLRAALFGLRLVLYSQDRNPSHVWRWPTISHICHTHVHPTPPRLVLSFSDIVGPPTPSERSRLAPNAR